MPTSPSGAQPKARSKAQPRQAPKKKRTRVAPVAGFRIYCHPQRLYIPATGVEVELDSWVERQLQLGCLKEL